MFVHTNGSEKEDEKLSYLFDDSGLDDTKLAFVTVPGWNDKMKFNR